MPVLVVEFEKKRKYEQRKEGIRCSLCGNTRWRTIRTIPRKRGHVSRVRQCCYCHAVVDTIETLDE